MGVLLRSYEPFGSLLPGHNYSSSNYRFGFNGQEKDDEVFSATGTAMTAEFWEYDTGTGRRWNLDPKSNPAISQYSAFAVNPILYCDPKGDTIVVNLFKRNDPTQKVFHDVANTAVSKQADDGVFLVYAHAWNGGIQYYDDQGKKQFARNAKEFNRVLSARSPEYRQALKEGRSIVLKLFACNVAAEEYWDAKQGKLQEQENTIAEQISASLPEGSTVIAANGFKWFGVKGGKPAILSVQETNDEHRDGTGAGGFETIRGGKTVAKRRHAYDPKTHSTSKGPKQKVKD